MAAKNTDVQIGYGFPKLDTGNNAYMFLGIDLGTSEIKLVLMNGAGQIVTSAGAHLSISRPKARWAEQDPDIWWQALLESVQLLRKNHAAQFAAIRAIGLSGQMHGATLLDRLDRPLRPSILWNDARADTECAELANRYPALEETTGNMAMPGFTAPKLLWVSKHEPDKFQRLASVLLPKDYLRLRLTGEKISDMSDASGTLWLDVAHRCWSEPALAATGLEVRHMPALVEGNAPAGQLQVNIARSWGIKHSVVIAGGGGDNAASAIGIGAVQPGDGFVSLGTSGVLFAVNDRPQPNPRSGLHAFCHALPDRWHQMSVMLSAASCLKWAVNITGAKNEATLIDEVASNALPPAAPIFLPYLSGERTPHNNPHAKGVFFGLTHSTDRIALGYSVLEGVAFGLADGLAVLQASGTNVRSMSLVGGGARSAYWAQLIANVLNIPINTHTGGETGAATGAARLAQMAFGLEEERACQKLEVLGTYHPEEDAADRLHGRLQQFRSLYAATKSFFNPD